MSACWATMRRVFFSPAPPMRIGILPGGWGVELGPPLLDHGKARRQAVEPLAASAELVPVLVIVPLEPARSRSEDEAALSGAVGADVIDCASHVRLQVGVPVAVAVHKGPEFDRRVCSASAPRTVHDSK